MRAIIKGILIFVVLIILTPIYALSEQNPGLSVPVTAGAFAAIYAIWKYDPDESNENSGSQLDKKDN